MWKKIDMSIFDDDLSDIRDTKLKHLIEFGNYHQIHFEKTTISLIESLGYNSSMREFSDYISNRIYNHNSGSVLNFSLIIKQLGTLKVSVEFDTDDDISIEKLDNILKIHFGVQNIKLSEIEAKIDHELHHIFMNCMGHKTNKNYFIVNELIKKYSGKTKAFLVLYYLSFPDEINSNIQMVFREIGQKNVKTKEDFLNFLKSNFYYEISDKMENFDMFNYWKNITNEGNDSDLIEELGVENLSEFFTKTTWFIRNAGKEYKKRLSRVFL